MPKYNHFARSKYDARTKKLDKFDKIITVAGVQMLFVLQRAWLSL